MLKSNLLKLIGYMGKNKILVT